MIKILMICHGNICRSTMAEFVLKDMVNKLGKSSDFIIKSVGTSREEIGNDTHYGTKNKLKEMGIPFSKRQAVQVVKSDYDNYDYLICMDLNNIRNLNRIIGRNNKDKVSLLLDYANRSGESIADPWYTDNFDLTYKDVVEGCTGLLKFLGY